VVLLVAVPRGVVDCAVVSVQVSVGADAVKLQTV
jgi:hypothetical protein